MPQDKYVRPIADKLNSEGAGMRPYGVGPTMRELRFKEIAETIGARSPHFPPTPRKKAMSNAAEAAKNNAKEYGTDIQRLQREMAAGTRKAQEYDEMDRRIARDAPKRIQAEMEIAKQAAEDRAYWERKKKEKLDEFGKTALEGTRRVQAASNKKTALGGTRRVQSASNGTFKGGAPRSSMSKNLKIKQVTQMPQEKRMSNKDYIASQSDKPYVHMEGSPRSFAIEGRGQDAVEEFRRNNKWYNDKKSSLGLLKTLNNMLSNERNGEAAARAMGMKGDAVKEYGSKTAKNSQPSYGAGKPVAKPVSADKATQMISAMTAKPKLASDAATNALFHKNRRRGDAAQYMRSLQFDMDDAKAAAEWRAEDKREKSPASIQKGMAASTRKTQAASAAARRPASNGTFKGGSPRSSMSKNLKIK